MKESPAFFGIEWNEWYFVYSSLPFGKKISRSVYNTMVDVLLSIYWIPLPPVHWRPPQWRDASADKDQYAELKSADECHLTAAKLAIFLVAYHLVSLGYFLGLQELTFKPRKGTPLLGISSRYRPPGVSSETRREAEIQ